MSRSAYLNFAFTFHLKVPLHCFRPFISQKRGRVIHWRRQKNESCGVKEKEKYKNRARPRERVTPKTSAYQPPAPVPFLTRERGESLNLSDRASAHIFGLAPVPRKKKLGLRDTQKPFLLPLWHWQSRAI